MARPAASTSRKRDLRVGSIGGIDEYGDTRGRRQHFAQQLQPLCRQFETQQIDAGQIAPWARQTGNETKLDRVFGDKEHDGNRRCCTFGRQRRGKACGRGNDRDLPANQIGRQLRQAIDLLGPAVVDRHVLALDIAGLFKALAKGTQALRQSPRAI